jgi:hypothetical protein
VILGSILEWSRDTEVIQSGGKLKREGQTVLHVMNLGLNNMIGI